MMLNSMATKDLSFRPSNHRPQEPKKAKGGTVLTAASAYEHSMALIRARLVSLERTLVGETSLMRAERIGFQVRKIVEGVTFAALSAVEQRNRSALPDKRTMDPSKLLAWLEKKSLLNLPAAQRIEPSPSSKYKVVLVGAMSENMNRQELDAAYSRASALVHERHPERLTSKAIVEELEAIREDARHLKSWLWLHLMHLRGESFLVQMGQFGSSSFFRPLTRRGDLPAQPW